MPADGLDGEVPSFDAKVGRPIEGWWALESVVEVLERSCGVLEVEDLLSREVDALEARKEHGG